jgi:hypothetical protein
MDIRFVVAAIAVLAFVLLPQLDHYTRVETGVQGVRKYLGRLARWVNS